MRPRILRVAATVRFDAPTARVLPSSINRRNSAADSPTGTCGSGM